MTNNCAVRQLTEALIAAGIPATIDHYQTINIIEGPLSAFITKRPFYCDRGRWLVNVHSTDSAIITIDTADMFPHYYFFDHCLVEELSHWWNLRRAQIKATAVYG